MTPMTGGRPSKSQPGWREVVLLAAGVVAIVIGAAIVTGLLPENLRDVVYDTPLTIAVLLVVTGWVLWRISRREPRAPDR
jgi:hypothetical protein